MPQHLINLTSLSSLAAIAGTITAFIAALNRHRIYRHFQHLFASFKKTSQLVSENERLTTALAESEQRNVDWEQQFENVDNLRKAIRADLERLTVEIEEIRRRMNAKDELNHLLQIDRDALLTWGRLLVGQMHASQIVPDYPAPPLRSFVAVPGPEAFTGYTGAMTEPPKTPGGSSL